MIVSRLGVGALITGLACAWGCGGLEASLIHSGTYEANAPADSDLAGLTMTVAPDGRKITLAGGPLQAPVSRALTPTARESWPKRCPMMMKTSLNQVATIDGGTLHLGALTITQPALIASCYARPHVSIETWPGPAQGRGDGIAFSLPAAASGP